MGALDKIRIILVKRNMKIKKLADKFGYKQATSVTNSEMIIF